MPDVDSGGWPSMWRDGRRKPRPVGAMALLVEIVRAQPKLGARLPCATNPALWDSQEVEDVIRAADVCEHHCPAYGRCHDFAMMQPDGALIGTVAGIWFAPGDQEITKARMAAT
jgi:hypothetical protein